MQNIVWRVLGLVCFLCGAFVIVVDLMTMSSGDPETTILAALLRGAQRDGIGGEWTAYVMWVFPAITGFVLAVFPPLRRLPTSDSSVNDET